MSQITNRIDHIVNHFASIYDTMWVHTDFLSNDEWTQLGNAHPEAIYGWTYPYEVEEDVAKSRLAISFNPERIVELSSTLDDGLFNEYVDAIEYILNTHIAFFDTKPLGERIRVAEETMYANGPGSLMLLSDVQVQALDR
jgi:hypothetical protein